MNVGGSSWVSTDAMEELSIDYDLRSSGLYYCKVVVVVDPCKLKFLFYLLSF